MESLVSNDAKKVYLSSNDGVYSWGVLTQAKPEQLKETSGIVFNGVTSIGNSIYLTRKDKTGIWKYENSELTLLEKSESYGFNKIIAKGNVLYMTTEGNDGIYKYVLDSSNPVEQLPGTDKFGFTGITLKANVVYVTTKGNDGVFKYDLDSKKLVQIPITKNYTFRELVIIDEILYMTTLGSDGIFKCDLQSNKLEKLPFSVKLGFNGIACVYYNVLLLTSQGKEGIWAYFVGTPNDPAKLTSTDEYQYISIA